MAQHVVDLSLLSAYVVEYAAVKVRYDGRDATIDLDYVRPGSQQLWNKHDLTAVGES